MYIRTLISPTVTVSVHNTVNEAIQSTRRCITTAGYDKRLQQTLTHFY